MTSFLPDFNLLQNQFYPLAGNLMNRKHKSPALTLRGPVKAGPLLEEINSMEDVRRLDTEGLKNLSCEVREFIVDTISRCGGHLSSSLGAVELTVALHHSFNTPQDKIIWDVGHQAYAHKILTGRRDRFHTIRTYGGLSGFPKMNESEFDCYDVGHSSTSLSLAIGEAIGRDLKGEDYKVIAVIGDGSLTGGMAFEALNQIGTMKHDVIIILNDNEHSISKNVGAMSTYLTRMISGTRYNRFRRFTQHLVRGIPKYGDDIYEFLYKVIGGFKGLFMLNNVFRDLCIRYFGPIDGHNMEGHCEVFERVKNINSGPKILHVITQKGRGYTPAERDPSLFHGVGPYDRATGICYDSCSKESYSGIAGKTLAHIARDDKKIVAITAAMKLGTGLVEFEKHAPERFFDVGIAEQHAITFAAALARTGMRPFVSIYSTFLQRATDQLIHDVGIMNLPVRLLIDRAGIVGADGETHHGLFDIAIIKNIPNFILLAPADGEELRDMIHFAASHDSGPVAIRFPRGQSESEDFSFETGDKFIPGKIRRLTRGGDCAILAAGDMVRIAMQARDLLLASKIETSVVNIRSIKPLDVKGLERVISGCDHFITLENGMESGGVGEQIMSRISHELCVKNLFLGAFPDRFITHGTAAQLFRECGLDAESLARRIEKAINER